jgi:hypothetical protein
MDTWKETLRHLAVPESLDTSIALVATAEADPIQMALTYDKVNDTLLQILAQQPMEQCMHVTGEARAISDPKHRRVCREVHNKGHICQIAGFLDGAINLNGAELMRWNQINWQEVSWQNHLDAFALFGNGEAVMFLSDRLAEIHFSLFDDQYVLLQAEHEHPKSTKQVWFLQSAELNQYLQPTVEKLMEASKPVDPRLFSDFNLSLSTDEALCALYELAEKGEIPKSDFLPLLGESGDRSLIDSNLRAIKFINSDDTRVRITSEGQEYLSLFS